MSETKKPKRKFSFFSSIISISMVLLMLGLFGIVLICSNKLSDYIRENIQVNVFFEDDINNDQINTNLAAVKEAPYTRSVRFVSKEQAAMEFSREIGQDFVSFLGYNPLMSSLQLNLKGSYAEGGRLNEVEEQLRALKGVKEVSYQRTVLDQINTNIQTIGSILMGLALVFMLIAMTLINNTVRLNLYTHRFLIKSMQLVGATRWFILKPYVGRSILHGFYGGMMASLLIMGILNILPLWIDQIDVLYDFSSFLVLFAFLVLTGMIISFVSCWWSTNRYLNSKIEDLY